MMTYNTDLTAKIKHWLLQGPPYALIKTDTLLKVVRLTYWPLDMWMKFLESNCQVDFNY